MERTPNHFSQAELQARLNYDPESGIFVWKNNPNKPVSWNQRYAGRRAGGARPTTRVIRLDRVDFLEHRLAFLYMVGYMPHEVDHKNGDPHDNRWDNIREVTHAENMQNQKVYSSSSSGYPGVNWHPAVNAWQARIQINGIRHDLGRFTDMEKAIQARKNAEQQSGFTNYRQHNKNS